MTYNTEEYRDYPADKAAVFEKISTFILNGDKESAKKTIIKEYYSTCT